MLRARESRDLRLLSDGLRESTALFVMASEAKPSSRDVIEGKPDRAHQLNCGSLRFARDDGGASHSTEIRIGRGDDLARSRPNPSLDVFGNHVATGEFRVTTQALNISSVSEIRLDAAAWPNFPVACSAQSYPGCGRSPYSSGGAGVRLFLRRDGRLCEPLGPSRRDGVLTPPSLARALQPKVRRPRRLLNPSSSGHARPEARPFTCFRKKRIISRLASGPRGSE